MFSFFYCTLLQKSLMPWVRWSNLEDARGCVGACRDWSLLLCGWDPTIDSCIDGNLPYPRWVTVLRFPLSKPYLVLWSKDFNVETVTSKALMNHSTVVMSPLRRMQVTWHDSVPMGPSLSFLSLLCLTFLLYWSLIHSSMFWMTSSTTCRSPTGPWHSTHKDHGCLHSGPGVSKDFHSVPHQGKFLVKYAQKFCLLLSYAQRLMCCYIKGNWRRHGKESEKKWGNDERSHLVAILLIVMVLLPLANISGHDMYFWE